LLRHRISIHGSKRVTALTLGQFFSHSISELNERIRNAGLDMIRLRRIATALSIEPK
jgi:hypothetical protein